MRKETQKHGIPVASLHRRQSAAPPGSLRRHRRGNHRRLLLCRTCCNGQLVRRLVQQSACKQVLSLVGALRVGIGRALSKIARSIATRKKGDPDFVIGGQTVSNGQASGDPALVATSTISHISSVWDHGWPPSIAVACCYQCPQQTNRSSTLIHHAWRWGFLLLA